MSRFVTLTLALAACGGRQSEPAVAGREAGQRIESRPEERDRLEPFAMFTDRRPTGVAVSGDGRVFVNFPYWEDPHDLSVVRVMPGGKLQAYPDAEWNTWDGDAKTAANHFVAVQSVWADARGSLWVLDAGAPAMDRVIQGAPKLVRIDLRADRVDEIYDLGEVVRPRSYLNDVRVDRDRGVAYLTDSGTGALVVLDLDSRRSRRVLANDPSTAAEDLELDVGQRPLRDVRLDDRPARIHADGLTLDRDGRYLYWHALTGRTLYRMDTRVLSDFERSDAALRDAVERVAETVASDGLAVDDQGRILHTAIEHDAIVAYDPETGHLSNVVTDPALSWPDSVAVARNGDLYVTTSRIHEMARFHGGRDVRTEPFGLYLVPRGPAVTQR
jgi:sugar lactone lactonase YvrE